MAQYAVGVDLGGTTVKAGLVERERGAVHHAVVPTEADGGPDRVIRQIVRAVDEVREGLPDGQAPCGIGLGAPGAISWDRTTVTKPPNLPGWDEVALAARLHERLGVPVTLENDANLAGLGSAHYGVGRPHDSFIMVTLGTGVGGAIIYEGQIFRGMRGAAGELGHVSIDYEGRYPRSGVAGGVEAYVGIEFLTYHARYALLNRKSLLHEMTGPDLRGLTPKMLHEAAVDGDEPAREILAWAGHKLGCALGSAINLLDIRKVVVGGGISAAGDFILEPVRVVLRQQVMPGLQDGVEVVRETLGNEVGILGAAMLAFEREAGRVAGGA